VDLASSLELPIVIHAREADDDAVDVLREAGDSRRGTVMHCFTGSVEFARRTLDLGCYISLAGIVTFPKAEELRAVARFVPDDRLLAETDSPFLAPVPYRGKRNEPAWVMRVIERLAEVRGVTAAELGSRLRDNYERLFRP
jgi:TatD DNase family protein